MNIFSLHNKIKDQTKIITKLNSEYINNQTISNSDLFFNNIIDKFYKGKIESK